MNPLELSERLREDYRRFTWTTYPIADPGLRERLEQPDRDRGAAVARPVPVGAAAVPA